MNIPFAFYYSSFEINLYALENVRLPLYKGSTLRGAFGHSFRSIICSNLKKQCNFCAQKLDCVYSFVFETPPPPDAKILKNYDHAPHPFIIEPPLDEKRNFQPDDIISYRLILLEPAIKYLPIFIYAFERMAQKGLGVQRGRFGLRSVFIKNGYEQVQIYDETDRVIHQERVKIQRLGVSKKESPEKIKIDFITPTRLKYDNGLVEQPEFHIIIRNLLRRLSIMNYYHGNRNVPEFAYKELIKKAETVKLVSSSIRWQDWARYSSRQARKIKMGGIVGRAEYMGEFEPFISFLRMGEILHIGKGAVFGLGKYELQTY